MEAPHLIEPIVESSPMIKINVPFAMKQIAPIALTGSTTVDSEETAAKNIIKRRPKIMVSLQRQKTVEIG